MIQSGGAICLKQNWAIIAIIALSNEIQVCLFKLKPTSPAKYKRPVLTGAVGAHEIQSWQGLKRAYKEWTNWLAYKSRDVLWRHRSPGAPSAPCGWGRLRAGKGVMVTTQELTPRTMKEPWGIRQGWQWLLQTYELGSACWLRRLHFSKGQTGGKAGHSRRLPRWYRPDVYVCSYSF